MLAYIPSPSWSSFSLGPFTIHAYALCILLGVAIAIWLTIKRWKAVGGTEDEVLDVALWAVPAGIIGGRIYHVATSPDSYFTPGKDPWEAVKIWHGGLGIWGAISLGTIVVYAACKHYKINFINLLDAAAPGLLIAQGIGRWGNWFNQELFGTPTTLPWGLKIDPTNPNFPAGTPANTLFHPTFLYESLWNIAGAFFLLWLDKKFNMTGGKLFCAYIITYSIGRALIEPIRTDPSDYIMGIRLNVIISVIASIIAATTIYFINKKQKNTEATVMK
ncbi:MAG: prolipoprotein diacylglyceryl transferase [Micrococcaceae bacterium]